MYQATLDTAMIELSITTVKDDTCAGLALQLWYGGF